MNSFYLQVTFQFLQTRLPKDTIPFEPSGDALEWRRIGGVDSFPPQTDIDNQPGFP
jgi:hypothetical protein